MAQPGDTVTVKTDEEEFTGILMPRPEILEDDVTILKLESGYNIGISSAKIESLTVQKKYEAPGAAPPVSQEKEGLPTVAVLSAGGTISSKVDYITGGVIADYTADDFVQMVPELADIANIRTQKISSVMSEDMEPSHWQAIAKAIAAQINESRVDGVVLTQGTDTLHYTSAALSYFLQELTVPVIITASQRSIDRGSSDAFMNLKCAIAAAGHCRVPGVMTCLHGTSDDDHCMLIPGTKVRKMHSSRRDAFRPINADPVAKVFEDGTIEYVTEEQESCDEPSVTLDSRFNERVGMLYCYPGMPPELLDSFSHYAGLVLVGTGLGNVNQKLFSKIEELSKNGTLVVIASQTYYGATHPLVYHNLRRLSVDMGCSFVHDMLPETAYVKLGWVLGHTSDREETRRLLRTPVAGDINRRGLHHTFRN